MEGDIATALRISSYAPLAPIMKLLPENPVVRLAVSLPAGAVSVDLRKIHCSINLEGKKDIEQGLGPRSESGFPDQIKCIR